MNSKPHCNEALRDEYRRNHPTCELYAMLKDHADVNHCGVFVPLRMLSPEMSIELNHIFSDNQRYDYVPNLISLGWVLHRPLFHQNLPLGRCLCLMAKYLKGGDDWRPDELNRAIGRRCQAYLDYKLPWPALEAERL